MGQNFDDYPGFQPFRSWANTYAQDCSFIDDKNSVDEKDLTPCHLAAEYGVCKSILRNIKDKDPKDRDKKTS